MASSIVSTAVGSGSLRSAIPSRLACIPLTVPPAHLHPSRTRAFHSSRPRTVSVAASSASASQQPGNAFAWQRAWNSPNLFQIRGISFYQDAAAEVEEGDPLLLVPERGNPHDEFAVAIFVAIGEDHCKVGYVPRELNENFQDGMYVGEAVSVKYTPYGGNIGIRVKVDKLTPESPGAYVDYDGDDQ